MGSDAVRMMGRWKHHGHISTLDHSLFVAYCSYRAARALRKSGLIDHYFSEFSSPPLFTMF